MFTDYDREFLQRLRIAADEPNAPIAFVDISDLIPSDPGDELDLDKLPGFTGRRITLRGRWVP